MSELFPDPIPLDREYEALCLQAARTEFERTGDPQELLMIVAYIGRVAKLDEQVRPQRIAMLNDAFLRDHPFPLVTPSILFLPDPDLLIQAVRDYDDFDAGNDPYGEHDFGAFDWHDERVLWKIDYTHPETGYWEDLLSPDCQRVLTIMTSEDY
jgi:Protein of unknown function (DUF3768)